MIDMTEGMGVPSRSEIEITRMLEEAKKFVAEQSRLNAEQNKLLFEATKLAAEADKLRRDHGLAPWMAVAAIIGGVVSTLVVLGKIYEALKI